MRLLLDTHALLWLSFDDPRLSERAAAAMTDPANEAILSVASLWEIAIKRQIGRLDLGMELAVFVRSFVDERALTLLPIEPAHLVAYDGLPLHHRDPFDRLLVAQARVLGVPVVTADASFSLYETETIW